MWITKSKRAFKLSEQSIGIPFARIDVDVDEQEWKAITDDHLNRDQVQRHIRSSGWRDTSGSDEWCNKEPEK